MPVCLKCGHDWKQRKSQRPRSCPKCKDPYWDVAPKSEKPNRELRRAIVRVDAQLLVMMLKNNDGKAWQRCVENPLPYDARAVGGQYDSITDCFELVVESSVFKLVDDVSPLPRIDPKVGLAFTNLPVV